MSVTALLFAAALSGQEPREHSAACYEEGRQAECEVAERARLNRLYRVDPIEDAARSGAVVYRTLIVDDWGGDVVLVTAMSQSSQPPRIIVQSRDGGRLVRNLSPMVWRRIVNAAKGIDDVRQPPPEPPSEPQSDVSMLSEICMHEWSVRIEMANAADAAGRARPVRRVRQGACSHDDRASEFGFMLADVAIAGLPICRALTEDDYRNAPRRLRACVDLRGDRRTAADLANRKNDPPDRHGTDWNVDEWTAWLTTGERGRLEWDGAVRQEAPGTPGSVAEAVAARVGDLAELDLDQTEFGARNGREGWIEGEIYASTKDEPDRRMVADYRQTWRRRDDGEWSLQTWIVGPFRSVP